MKADNHKNPPIGSFSLVTICTLHQIKQVKERRRFHGVHLPPHAHLEVYHTDSAKVFFYTDFLVSFN